VLNRWIVPLESRIDYLNPAHREEVSGAVRRPAHLRDET